MKTVQVNLGPRSYNIYIGSGLLGGLGQYMKALDCGEKVLLVTNPAVSTLYGGTVIESLVDSGFNVVTGEIGDGEEYKTLATAEKLYDLAFTSGLDRNCPVVVLGGGVTGDVAGFVAATYLRGVPFIQVPTTLLAQVDSSVGGKVAVNHPKGKNIIGAFYQPSLVLADINTLGTLPSREVRTGVAEVIKYGVIWSADFFVWLEENLEALLQGDLNALAFAVRESCRIKAKVVEEDETEQDLRAILNFGHTVGHAVEALTGYTRYTHGEAVGIGMVAAARLAVFLEMISLQTANKVADMINRAGLPMKIPPELSSDDLLDCMRLDKKARAGRYVFILPIKIGKVRIVRDVPEDAVREALQISGR